MLITMTQLLNKFVDALYSRDERVFDRGKFRVKGDTIDIWTPDSEHTLTRISFFGDEIDKISYVNSITGKTEFTLAEMQAIKKTLETATESEFTLDYLFEKS